MGLDRYQLLILILGIPMTSLLIVADHSGMGIDVQFAVALLWTGIGSSLLLLSWHRRTRKS